MIFLDKNLKKEIVHVITLAEKMTSGEIRVHIQSRCKEDVLHDAKKVFHRLKMHKTRERNGTLIFIALESKKFAILGDKGIHEQVGDAFWNETRDIMKDHFRSGRLKEGILAGVENAGRKLQTFFPRKASDQNELSNRVTED